MTHHHDDVSPADTKVRVINLLAILVPFAAFIIAVTFFWGYALTLPIFIIMMVMGIATAFGITVGFHRLVTHKSFETIAPVRFLFAVLGSMAVQGPVIEWAATHRKHHQHSDDEHDPHSPHSGAHGSWGQGIRATLRGAFHAHFGWLLMGHRRGLGRYSKDLREDPVLVAVSRQFPLWVLAGLVIPAVLGGLFTQSWIGVLQGFLWGGLVRIFVVHHITWSVNSVCHIWGTHPFRSHDHSRNNAIVGILAMGEGWHNNHHAFPTSARHGLRWWEFDASYMLIRTLSFFGLAHRIRTVSAEQMRAKRSDMSDIPAPVEFIEPPARLREIGVPVTAPTEAAVAEPIAASTTEAAVAEPIAASTIEARPVELDPIRSADQLPG
ncbi:MAG: acyl-CoA desaturase [Phycisphaerales bacterium]|nr:acyl-CoA desaturase [Phycisphaerales bacterium]